MNEYPKQWLAHLKNSIPQEAYGYTISMYCVALEGWRRGLDLKFINSSRSKAHTLFSLSNEDKEHVFSVSRGDKVPKSAIQICINKNLTKEYLLRSDVPAPLGANFNSNATEDEIVTYANKIKYPLVIKPSDGTGGKGVIAKIKSEVEFKKALDYVRNQLNFNDIIVEKHFEGEDFRVYVINNEVIGAIKRVPANVYGNGINTIRELLNQKNKKRNQNPALYRRPIRIDKEMNDMLLNIGYTLDSVPKKNERVFLKSKNNVSVGGDSIDATDELSDEVKQIAVDASNAIPGLVQCGVDLMVNQNSNEGVVLEINSRPHITAQLFPSEGLARDIPKAIIDYYFPNTVSNNKSVESYYYFGVDFVFDSFRKGNANEIMIPKIPDENMQSIMLNASKISTNFDFEKWIWKLALKFNLNGYVEKIAKQKYSISISGNEKSLKKFRDVLKSKSSTDLTIDYIEKEDKEPIKIGFEIIKDKKAKRQKRSLHKKANKISSEENLPKSNDTVDYKKKYDQIKNSTSWKITKPIRKIKEIYKKNQRN